ncbi:MAG TPA: hypothetical protein VM487_17445 [Phycisphaerae bacterium]|nr:hypothetical protein [Phycisphaerae bacterium]
MTTNIKTRLYLRKSLLSLICARPDFRGSNTAGYLFSAARNAHHMSYGPGGKTRIPPVGTRGRHRAGREWAWHQGRRPETVCPKPVTTDNGCG